MALSGNAVTVRANHGISTISPLTIMKYTCLAIVLLLNLAGLSQVHADIREAKRFDPLPQGAGLSSIVSDGAGRFVGVGDRGNVMVSTDRQTWRNVGLGIDLRLRAITYAGGKPSGEVTIGAARVESMMYGFACSRS